MRVENNPWLFCPLILSIQVENDPVMISHVQSQPYRWLGPSPFHLRKHSKRSWKVALQQISAYATLLSTLMVRSHGKRSLNIYTFLWHRSHTSIDKMQKHSKELQKKDSHEWQEHNVWTELGVFAKLSYQSKSRKKLNSKVALCKTHCTKHDCFNGCGAATLSKLA